ncbi:HemK methyltransferase member 2 [Ptychographa xylographoides]|nr:HemK methyltransferase member 2 [Ptychographa xylographoides]
MLPTPSTSHVDINRIYEPAEDSFLFLDALSASPEIDFLTDRFSHRQELESPAPLVVEVGTGSGVVLAFLTANARSLFGRADVLTLGIDLNEYACSATTETVRRACNDAPRFPGSPIAYGTFLGEVQGDLTSSILPGAIDVLVFNPPYVPTSELPKAPMPSQKDSFTSATRHGKLDEDSHLLSLSYAGGKDGMEVTARLLEQLPYVLSKERGIAYILLCQQNKPEEVMALIRAWGGQWAVETVRRSGKAAGWEKLQVVRIWQR